MRVGSARGAGASKLSASKPPTSISGAVDSNEPVASKEITGSKDIAGSKGTDPELRNRSAVRSHPAPQNRRRHHAHCCVRALHDRAVPSCSVPPLPCVGSLDMLGRLMSWVRLMTRAPRYTALPHCNEALSRRPLALHLTRSPLTTDCRVPCGMHSTRQSVVALARSYAGRFRTPQPARPAGRYPRTQQLPARQLLLQ